MYRASLPSYVGAVPLLHLWQQWCSSRAAKEDFWQARPSQWGPHLWRATATATTYYSAKFRQDHSLAGLTSRGGPELSSHHLRTQNTVDDFAWFYFSKKTKQKRRMVQTSGGWKNSNQLSIFVMLLLLFSFLLLQNLVGLLPPTDPRFRRSCKKLKQTQF